MIKELYNAPEAANLRPEIRKNAIILKKEKWDSIMRHLDDGNDVQNVTEQEAKYKEYLKQSSRNMTKKWDNTVQNIRERKEMEKELRKQDRIREDLESYKALKISDEQKRREFIERAENVIQKEKSGPRNLESAAKLCEVLQVRELQKEFTQEQKKLADERKRKEDENDILQANKWLNQYAERQVNERQRFNMYKKELYDGIKHDEMSRKDNLRRHLETERLEHQSIERAYRERLDKENTMHEMKKEMRRKAAVEAMKMAMERERSE
jgi:hypothetical protein